MSLASPLPRDARPHRRISASLKAGLIWSVVASGVNVLIWLVASAAGVNFTAWPQGPDQPSVDIGPLSIVGATVFAGVVASIVVGIMGKLIKKVVRWIILVGVIFAAASLAGPWQQPEPMPTSTRIILTVMHLVTAGCVIFGLARGVWTDDRAVRF